MSKVPSRIWAGLADAVAGAGLGAVVTAFGLLRGMPIDVLLWAVLILGFPGAIIGFVSNKDAFLVLVDLNKNMRRKD